MPLASLTPGLQCDCIHLRLLCICIHTSCSTDNLTVTMEEVIGATSLDSNQPAKVLFARDNRYVQEKMHVLSETR